MPETKCKNRVKRENECVFPPDVFFMAEEVVPCHMEDEEAEVDFMHMMKIVKKRYWRKIENELMKACPDVFSDVSMVVSADSEMQEKYYNQVIKSLGKDPGYCPDCAHKLLDYYATPSAMEPQWNRFPEMDSYDTEMYRYPFIKPALYGQWESMDVWSVGDIGFPKGKRNDNDAFKVRSICNGLMEVSGNIWHGAEGTDAGDGYTEETSTIKIVDAEK
ncbi:hypothetical protein ACFLY5_01200 [Patescibacteria group bacterium]